MSKKIYISFTRKDVIYYCLQNFAWTHQECIKDWLNTWMIPQPIDAYRYFAHISFQINLGQTEPFVACLYSKWIDIQHLFILLMETYL